jgi:hypothetical protein
MRIHRAVAVLILTLAFSSTLYARHRSAPTVPVTEIEGVLKNVSATQLVVTDSHKNDVIVNITKDTIFRGGDVPITASDLAVGDHVEIKAAMQPDNTLNALVVKDEKEVLEIVGVIKSVSPTELVITDAQQHDTTVELTDHTIIRHGDQMLTAGDLVVGDQVEVKAVQAGTMINALIVKVEQNEPPDDDQEDLGVAGTVSAIGASSLTVTTQSRGDFTVNVDEHTRIRKGSQTISIADIKIGDHLEAEGKRIDDHTILAREIQVQPSH